MFKWKWVEWNTLWVLISHQFENNVLKIFINYFFKQNQSYANWCLYELILSINNYFFEFLSNLILHLNLRFTEFLVLINFLENLFECVNFIPFNKNLFNVFKSRQSVKVHCLIASNWGIYFWRIWLFNILIGIVRLLLYIVLGF